MMLTIQTRQNRKGNWWCNTTFNGEDISVESRTIDASRCLIIEELTIKREYAGGWKWSEPEFYVNNIEKQRSYITYCKSRIDNNPIA
jgi:hypothetical protein